VVRRGATISWARLPTGPSAFGSHPVARSTTRATVQPTGVPCLLPCSGIAVRIDVTVR
jgi:hypothetical protein